MPLVRPALAEELQQVGTTLAAAFDGDPVWSWLASPNADWSPRAATWFATEAQIQMNGHGEVLVDDELRGAAIWAQPDHWKASPREMVSLTVPTVRLFRAKTLRGMRTMSAMEKLHPTAPHWYLAILGTDPAHQGHGIGSALIGAITDRCDEQGLPAYLESSKEQNVAFYARHGFEVTAQPSLPGGPKIWLMWREPR